MALDVNTLSAADLAIVLAHARKQEEAAAAARKAEAAARKAERVLSRSYLARFVGILVRLPDLPQQTFKSGAQGWNLGGKDVAVMFDGKTRMARVSILVRWEDTIPVSEQDA